MIQIITDSAADFTPQEMEKLKIHCIPLIVMFGDREYQENIDLTRDQFYDLLTMSDQQPRTSQPSPKVVEELFHAAHGNGGAVYITLSSGLSGTYQSAEMIRQMLEYDDCFVVDSRSATGGQRILVEEAVRLREQGRSAREIAESIEKMRSRISLSACINTLEYLHRGGRISHASYRLGTLANIKPIIEILADGSVGIPGKAMGMRMGMEQLGKRLESRRRALEGAVYVMYTSSRDVGRALAERLKKYDLHIGEERIVQVGAAIGAHIGPDACGLVYVTE